jgi:hypothetical protein
MELGAAVPQVIAHRVARMAIAGASPSARDRPTANRSHALAEDAQRRVAQLA